MRACMEHDPFHRHGSPCKLIRHTNHLRKKRNSSSAVLLLLLSMQWFLLFLWLLICLAGRKEAFHVKDLVKSGVRADCKPFRRRMEEWQKTHPLRMEDSDTLAQFQAALQVLAPPSLAEQCFACAWISPFLCGSVLWLSLFFLCGFLCSVETMTFHVDRVLNGGCWRKPPKGDFLTQASGFMCVRFLAANSSCSKVCGRNFPLVVSLSLPVSTMTECECVFVFVVQRRSLCDVPSLRGGPLPQRLGASQGMG